MKLKALYAITKRIEKYEIASIKEVIWDATDAGERYSVTLGI